MKWVVCMLFCLYSNVILAQKDTEFWFAAPEVDSANNPAAGKFDRPILIRLTATSMAASVEVSMPAFPAFTPITANVAANSTYTIDLTPWINFIENQTPNTALNRGLLINSSC